MKGKEKLIGIILMVVLGVVAGALGYNSEELKSGLCGTPSVAPSPGVTGVTGVTAPSH
jgi:hypothetical protein